MATRGTVRSALGRGGNTLTVPTRGAGDEGRARSPTGVVDGFTLHRILVLTRVPSEMTRRLT